MTTVISSAALTILPLAVGAWEIVAIVAVFLLLFGGRKIPELMRGLGKGVKEFKAGMKEADDTIKEVKKEIAAEEAEKSATQKDKSETAE